MSPAEVILWQALRRRPGGFKFRRQFAVEGYTADFACLSARLLIEVDGNSHDFATQAKRDEARDARLAAAGFRTLRIPAVHVFKELERTVAGVVHACGAHQG